MRTEIASRSSGSAKAAGKPALRTISVVLSDSLSAALATITTASSDPAAARCFFHSDSSRTQLEHSAVQRFRTRGAPLNFARESARPESSRRFIPGKVTGSSSQTFLGSSGEGLKAGLPATAGPGLLSFLKG